MKKAIIYSENERAAGIFSDLLESEGFTDVLVKERICFCGVDAEASLQLINAGENYDSAIRLAEKLPGVTSASVMFLADEETCESHGAHLRENGVIVLTKPLSKQLFLQSVQDAEAMHGRIRRMAEQLDEVRKIARAKLILVEKQQMTEQQAHKYIEKEAMNRRITRLQLAEELIQNAAN